MTLIHEEFADLLNPSVRRSTAKRSHRDSVRYQTFPSALKRNAADNLLRVLDRQFTPLLSIMEAPIPVDSITKLRRDYQEQLPKTMRCRTAFIDEPQSKAGRLARSTGLYQMMSSSSLIEFAQQVTGLRLSEQYGLQVICYRPGDYVGPHNDHHPQDQRLRNGFVDFHISLRNEGVAHQRLVYEKDGHLSSIANAAAHGAVSVYRLPFWHYVTPLTAKPGAERSARRWLLLTSLRIEEGRSRP